MCVWPLYTGTDIRFVQIAPIHPAEIAILLKNDS